MLRIENRRGVKNYASDSLADGTMVKTMNTLMEDSVKGNQKIWPLLGQERNAKEITELRQPQESAPLSRKTCRFLRSSQTNEAESFHCAISSVLSVAQLFGVLPLFGIRSPSPLYLKFTLFSFRTAYAVFILSCILTMAILSIVHMTKTLNVQTFELQGGVAAATSGAMFYTSSLLGIILFFRLSPRWVILQNDWRSMELFIDSNKLERPTLRWKFTIISGVILSLALIEHVLSIVKNVENFEWGTPNSTFEQFIRVYTFSSHSFILHILEYNFLLGLFIFVVSKVATFMWNFMDLFVILVATGLAERYKTLNKMVILSANKCGRSIDWSELRGDYAVLSSMVKKVDNNISAIILLSFANNLYFICLQLLNGLSMPTDGNVSVIYFFGSFGFLIGRTCAVTLLVARIHDQSRVVLPALYNCSSSAYNVETQRLQYQLTTDDVALTGMRFFSITRNFMLAVAGAIVTYEVVLLQFNVSIKR